jgi:hypothetical protein
MKGWRDNPSQWPVKKNAPTILEDDIDPQDWVLDVVHELDHKMFRRIDFMSQTMALTTWMCGKDLAKDILLPS